MGIWEHCFRRGSKGEGQTDKAPTFTTTTMCDIIGGPIRERGDDTFACHRDLKICLCGTFCTPCLLAESLEAAGEGDFWFNMFVMLAPMQCNAGIPGSPSFWCSCGTGTLCTVASSYYLARSVDAVNRRWGAPAPNLFNTWLMMECCRPCLACQMARAVKAMNPGVRFQFIAGGDRSSLRTVPLAQEDMTRYEGVSEQYNSMSSGEGAGAVSAIRIAVPSGDSAASSSRAQAGGKFDA